MVENWVNDARNKARAAFDARFEVEVKLGALKEKQSKLAEQMKEAIRARDSAEAGLKTTKKQFKISVNSCTTMKLIWQQRSN